MPLQYEPVPKQAQFIVRKSLIPDAGEIMALDGGNALRPRRISKAFAVYSADLEDVLDGARGLLRSAQLTSYQYVVFVGNEIESLREVAKGKPFRYASRQSPAIAKAVLAAIDRAEAMEGVQKRNYTVRLLRVPELYLFAVWLHSATEDLLLPVEPVTRALRGRAVLTEQEVIDALKPIAAIRARTADI